jgi:hypothetical protein
LTRHAYFAVGQDVLHVPSSSAQTDICWDIDALRHVS